MKASVVSSTKLCDMITVFMDWYKTGLRLGLRDLDVRKRTIHRSCWSIETLHV